MPVRWNCSHCGQMLSVPTASAGRRTRCPTHRTVLTVPARTDRPAPPTAADTADARPRGRGLACATLVGLVLFLAAGATVGGFALSPHWRGSSQPTEPQQAFQPPADPQAPPVEAWLIAVEV
jgi:hypothetical protein